MLLGRVAGGAGFRALSSFWSRYTTDGGRLLEVVVTWLRALEKPDCAGVPSSAEVAEKNAVEVASFELAAFGKYKFASPPLLSVT